MGLFESFKTKKETPQLIKRSVIYRNKDSVTFKLFTEQFKGIVFDDKIRFPSELGVQHPFDFKIAEGLYKSFGLVTGVIDKYIDFIVGPGFYIECEDERGKKIIEDFIRDTNFDSILRAWIKEALIKGNGFLELGGSKNEVPQGMKVLNANTIYVQRSIKGTVELYNQYHGFNKGITTFDMKKITTFNTHQIAHLAFNKVGDEAYGLGIVSPAFKIIDNLMQSSKNMHMLLDRKANVPYHVKIGDMDHLPAQEDVTAFGQDFEYLKNDQEWITGGDVEIKTIDFGNIGEKFSYINENDKQDFIYTVQVPEVLLGSGNIAEGLAKEQLKAFERRIQSLQVEIEKVVETQIFKRILNANGMDFHVEFEWGEPSYEEENNRIIQINETLKNPFINPELRRILEMELARLYGLKKEDIESIEEEKQREMERPQPLVPGQNNEEEFYQGELINDN